MRNAHSQLKVPCAVAARGAETRDAKSYGHPRIIEAITDSNRIPSWATLKISSIANFVFRFEDLRDLRCDRK